MKKASASAFASVASPLARRIRQRKQPVQGRSRATVAAILEAALQVLLGKGYAAFTTTRVAERAGVSVGTLYQYFPDKQSLVTALKVQYFEILVGHIAAAGHAAAGLALEPALRSMVSALLVVKRRHRALTLALREPMVEAGGESIVRESTGRLVEVVRRVLSGAEPALRDPAAVGGVLVGAIEGVISSILYADPGQLDRPELEDELVALGVGYVRERRRAAPRRAGSP